MAQGRAPAFVLPRWPDHPLRLQCSPNSTHPHALERSFILAQPRRTCAASWAAPPPSEASAGLSLTTRHHARHPACSRGGAAESAPHPSPNPPCISTHSGEKERKPPTPRLRYMWQPPRAAPARSARRAKGALTTCGLAPTSLVGPDGPTVRQGARALASPPAPRAPAMTACSERDGGRRAAPLRTLRCRSRGAQERSA